MKNTIKIIYENKRPYLLDRDINYLAALINGTIFSQEIHGNLSKENRLFKEEFNKWICHTHSYYEKDENVTWDNVILFRNFNSRGQALDVFLKLYKEWYIEKFGEDAW